MVVNDNRRFVLAFAFLFACGVVVAAIAGLALREARQADQRAVEQAAVVACEARNQGRADTQAVFAYMLDLAAASAQTAGRPPSPLTAEFRTFVGEAFDPVSCDVDAADFGVDADPPSTSTLPGPG